MPVFTEREIVAAYQNGQQIEAVTEYLYSTYYRTIRELVRRFGGNEQDAEDLFQETMLTFIEIVRDGRYEVRQEATLKTYLYAIAYNIWRKRWNRSNRQQDWEKEFSERYSDLLESVDHYNDKLTVTQLMKQLKEPCRTILYRFYIEGFSLEEIAEELKMNEPTVRQRKFRCLKKLRELL